MQKAQRSFIISILLTAAILAGLVFYLYNNNHNYDVTSLIIGDIALAAISIFSFVTIVKGLKSENPNALIRAKYTGTLVKFFLCIALLIAYIFINHKVVHKPSLFLFLGMYIVYSALEAIPLSRLAKNTKK